jgi:type IV pilus assembly protein PilA
LEVFSMKKMLKQNKGFSLVELLVAILIMAVIAATAITLFGGVLRSSREGADEETAESIKRAVLTYMSMTNDTNLSCLDLSDGGKSDKLIRSLACIIEIDADTGVKFTKPANVDESDFKTPDPVTDTDKIEASDIKGEFGPFLDASKDMSPKTPGTNGWSISIDEKAQVVIVKAEEADANCKVSFDGAEGEGEGEGEDEGG